MLTHSASMEGAPSPSRSRSRRRGSRTLKPIDAAVRRLDDAFNDGDLPEIKQCDYKVLRHYLTAADLRKPGAVYPTPSATLEKLTGYSARSVSAANTSLVRAGLIERLVTMEGRRDPEWRTVLTPKCLGLFFGHHSQEIAPPVDRVLSPSDGQGAAPQAPVDKSTEQPEQPQPELPRPPEPADGQAIHIRDDLKPLLAVLKPAEVVKVLGIAKAADVRVQDVMAHRLPAILVAKEPVGLLVHLIDSGQDWKRPVTVPGQRKKQVSEANSNTKAGWRQDEARRRKETEDQSLKAAPPAGHRAAIEAMKAAVALRKLQGGANLTNVV
jgi:hypothetical protein